jgi:hypothetical protein
VNKNSDLMDVTLKPVSTCALNNVQCQFPDCIGTSCVEDRVRYQAKYPVSARPPPPNKTTVQLNIPATAEERARQPALPDSIVETVRADLLRRSRLGIAKYGVTLDRKDLSLVDWLRHAYEEALDEALYLRRAIAEIEDEK